MAQANSNGLYSDSDATFEQNFKRLQEVVQTLSEGNLSLQEALSAFEEGMALADKCTQMLDTAELRLKQIGAQASRAGADALGELDRAMRHSPRADAGDDILSLDITSFEQRLVFDVPTNLETHPSSSGSLAYSPLQGEKRGTPASEQDSTRKGGIDKGVQGKAPFASGDELELDPLFDEDD